MPTADREGLGVDREALRQEMARLGFNGWYGRDEYDAHPVQGMWERTADAQLAGPLLSAALAQADTAERMGAERDEADWKATLRYCEHQWQDERGVMLDKLIVERAEVARLSAEVAALRAGLTKIASYPDHLVRINSAAFHELKGVAQDTLAALTRTTDQPDPGAREGSSLPVEAAAQEGQTR